MQHHPLKTTPNPEAVCRDNVRASHAAIAIDCANYYRALHEAIVRAKHSIFVVGWDIDSRIKLLRGEHLRETDYPARFFALMQWKARKNPNVNIYLNGWDYSIFMAKHRDYLAGFRWRYYSPKNLHFVLDNTVPLGASHHQKIITVDDEIAFCGGMDIALKRWDEREHMPRNLNRIDPMSPAGEGVVFEPYHDTQMLVAGEAAQALAEQARFRWHRATDGGLCAPLRPARFSGELPDCWPSSLPPTLHDIPMRISRTMPQWGDFPSCFEVEQSYIEAIAQAERFIYIENQFLCRLPIAEALNRQLRRKPKLQALIVSSYNPNGIMEAKTMWHGRVKFRDIVESGGVKDRVIMAYPLSRVGEIEKSVRIHSKLMVVDDTLLRIGSSNINNRSMTLDTECDLTFAAETPEHQQSIAAIRNDLIREHTGHELAAIQRVAEGKGSVEYLLTYLSHSRQHLCKINDERYRYEKFTRAANWIADPETPLLPIGVSMAMRKTRLMRIFIVILCVAALGLMWKYTPLSRYATPDTVIPILEQVRHTPWAVPTAMLVYTLGTLAFFPHMAMTATIVLVFDPLQAFSIAMTGSLVSGAIGFWAGRKLGLRSVRALVGDTAERISLYAKKGGVVGITLLRLLPIAPYTAVNIALGMLEVTFFAFMAGTFLGTLPGTVIAAFLGHSALELWQNPSMENIGAIAIGLVCWIGIVAGSHYAARQWRKYRGKPAIQQ